MLNTDSGYPPFEGQITSDPDNGFQFTVTIPFFGIRGVPRFRHLPGDKLPDNLITADSPQGAGGTVTLTNTTFPNRASRASQASALVVHERATAG